MISRAMTELDSSEKLPTTDISIDPALLALSNNSQVPSPSLDPAQAPAAPPPSSVTATRPELEPTRDASGLINTTREEYANKLCVPDLSPQSENFELTHIISDWLSNGRLLSRIAAENLG
jgi:hypothetical protein